METFNTDLQENYNCRDLLDSNDDDGDSSLLQTFLTGAEVCSFEDPSCPDPHGILQKYHKLAMSDRASQGNRVVPVMLWVLACLFVASAIALMTARPSKPMEHSPPRSPDILQTNTPDQPRRDKQKRSRLRKVRRSAKSRKRRFWQRCFSPGATCCADDSTILASTLSQETECSSSVVEMSTRQPRSGNQTERSCLEKANQSHAISDVPIIPSPSNQECFDDPIEIARHDVPRGRSPDPEINRRRGWFRPRSPTSRHKNRQHEQESDVLSVHETAGEGILHRISSNDTPVVLTVLPTPKPIPPRKLEMKTELEIPPPSVDKPTATSNELETSTSLVNTTSNATSTTTVPVANKSITESVTSLASVSTEQELVRQVGDLTISQAPRSVHVKITEPGTSETFEETIKTPRIGDSREAPVLSLLERSSPASQSTRAGKDPPGVLQRVPTADTKPRRQKRTSPDVSQEEIFRITGVVTPAPTHPLGSKEDAVKVNRMGELDSKRKKSNSPLKTTSEPVRIAPTVGKPKKRSKTPDTRKNGFFRRFRRRPSF